MSEIKGTPTDVELSEADDKLLSPGWINLLDSAGLTYRERQVIGWALRMAPRLRTENAELRAELAECTKVQCVQHISELTDRAERAEAEIEHEKAQTKIVLDAYVWENQQLSDRAEQAEASLAEELTQALEAANARVAELEGRIWTPFSMMPRCYLVLRTSENS